MVGLLHIRVYDGKDLAFSGELDGPVELGRQCDRKEGVYSSRPEGGRWRVVIAGLDEDAVSRKHTLLVPVSDGRVRLTNTSSIIPLALPCGRELEPGQSGEVDLPIVLAIGRRTVRVEGVGPAGTGLLALSEATVVPGRQPRAGSRLPGPGRPHDGVVDVESLVRWLQVIMGVLQTAASSSDFFRRAAQAVVEIVGLDTGRVLVLDDGRWRERSLAIALPPPPAPTWRPSRQVLARLGAEKKTFWQAPDPADSHGASLVGLDAVVAAPILDRDGEVIGALYGERRHGGGTATLPRIERVDALLTELLAGGVASGLARIEQEKATLEAQIRFEQFFTPELARELAADPGMLIGRDEEVSVLFCDVRGFARISERLGPAATFRWIGDIMTTFSACVLDRRGTLVDIIGDQIIAMWGAPKADPDHARSACSAALDMLARLPELDGRWRATAGEPLDVGVGINTGIAQVGNTGSGQKFKYGALGHTVNLASRFQGATRYLKVQALISGPTRERLDPSYATRRIGKVEVLNITEPVELYELAPAGRAGWADLRDAYELALGEFESRGFRRATTTLGNLLVGHPDDGPALALLLRAVLFLTDEPLDFSPIWKLPGK